MALRAARCLALARPAILSTGQRLVCKRPSVLSRQNTACICPAFSSSLHTSTVHHNVHIINIQDEADFKTRVLDVATPVIVDFHAGWCGPCKMLGPRLESMVAAENGAVILAKIDIDEHTDLAIEHGVEAVPTVLAVKNGKVVDKFVGVKDEADLESFLNKLKGA